PPDRRSSVEFVTAVGDVAQDAGPRGPRGRLGTERELAGVDHHLGRNPNPTQLVLQPWGGREVAVEQGAAEERSVPALREILEGVQDIGPNPIVDAGRLTVPQPQHAPTAIKCDSAARRRSGAHS